MLNALIYLLIQSDAVADTAQEVATPAQNSGWSSLIMIVALIAIFYFLMIRPQQKKQKEIKKFRDGIKPGNNVITAGGIHGKVKSVNETSFLISIAPQVEIKVDKGSVYPADTQAENIPVKEA